MISPELQKKMDGGVLYDPSDPSLMDLQRERLRMVQEYNSIDPRDFVENGTISVPDEITIDMSLNAGSEIAVKSVTAALDLGGYGIEPTEVSIGELPDFLSGDNVTLDLYNPVIRLDVLADEANTPDIHFPEFTLSASLDAFGKDGQSTMDSPISLNDIAIRKGMNSPNAIIP